MILDRFLLGESVDRKGKDEPYYFEGYRKDNSEIRAHFYRSESKLGRDGEPIAIKGSGVSFGRQELERLISQKTVLINMFGEDGQKVSDLRLRMKKLLSLWPNAAEDIQHATEAAHELRTKSGGPEEGKARSLPPLRE